MRLYLAQHGEANPKEADPERHLTAKGRADATRVAAALRPAGLRVAEVWHSGKARAAETADILAPAFGATGKVAVRDDLAPKDPVGPVKKAVLRRDDDLLIVGHLPFLARLAAALLTGEESNEVVAFQQGGVVCLGRAPDGLWRVRWAIVPDPAN